jgi:hypothetical protein
MGSNDRKAYIKAVKCMFSSPSKSDPALVPGAKVRQVNMQVTSGIIADYLL